jgi:hypothetical protein
MNQYFFKMNQAEKNSILDQHKSLYDGFVTQYGQKSNQQPLYVQDFANDKNGITVSNKGDVKGYTNVNINENFDGKDKIADGPHDLQNGTFDFRGTPDMSDVDREYFHDTYPSPNEDEIEFISLGLYEKDDDDDDDDYKNLSMYNPYYGDKNFDFDGEDEECKHCDGDKLDIVIDVDDLPIDEVNEFEFNPEYDDSGISEIGNYKTDTMNFDGELDESVLPKFMEQLNESLDMFKRFKKYN